MIAFPAAADRNRASPASLCIGGVERLSTVDWPGMLVAVVFCQGCGWRCSYCHNPHLIPFASPATAVLWNDIVKWLERRRGLLDGVVFSGGEPTLQSGLAAAIADARGLGFKVGLHTGGPVPETLQALLPQVDWVGFDFKAPFDRYAKVTGQDHGGRARKSFHSLMGSGVSCEIRTTWHPRLLSDDDLVAMAKTLVEAGCAEWVIQRFRADGCADLNLTRYEARAVPLAAVCLPGLRVIVR